jgi:hypothetical protein
MASIPPLGMDLRVTLTKIKEAAEVKHFCLPGWYYKTQKNRLVKGFGPAYPRFPPYPFQAGRNRTVLDTWLTHLFEAS